MTGGLESLTLAIIGFNAGADCYARPAGLAV
jgi:hypothetical protein